MTKAQYEVFEALNPFFGVVLKGVQGLVGGKHYFDTFAEDALFQLGWIWQSCGTFRGSLGLGIAVMTIVRSFSKAICRES